MNFLQEPPSPPSALLLWVRLTHLCNSAPLTKAPLAHQSHSDESGVVRLGFTQSRETSAEVSRGKCRISSLMGLNLDALGTGTTVSPCYHRWPEGTAAEKWRETRSLRWRKPQAACTGRRPSQTPGFHLSKLPFGFCFSFIYLVFGNLRLRESYMK